MNSEKMMNIGSVIVLGFILTIFCGAVFARLGQRIGIIDPHVFIVAGEGEKSDQIAHTRENPAPLVPSAVDGEVTRTTERLRELGAVTLSLSLFAVGERLKGKEIKTVDELVGGAAQQELMPPGVFVEQQNGVLNATHPEVNGKRVSHGNLFVRYRPDPFDLEILSVPLEQKDGPMLLMRAPLRSKANESINYYSALRFDNVNIPEPFAKESIVIANGWTKEELKTVAMPQEDKNELREWSEKQKF